MSVAAVTTTRVSSPPGSEKEPTNLEKAVSLNLVRGDIELWCNARRRETELSGHHWQILDGSNLVSH